jgi:hypothetical protein
LPPTSVSWWNPPEMFILIHSALKRRQHNG